MCPMQGLAPVECMMAMWAHSPPRRLGVPHPIPSVEGQGLGPRVSVVFDPLFSPAQQLANTGPVARGAGRGTRGGAALWRGLKA